MVCIHSSSNSAVEEPQVWDAGRVAQMEQHPWQAAGGGVLQQKHDAECLFIGRTSIGAVDVEVDGPLQGEGREFEEAVTSGP